VSEGVVEGGARLWLKAVDRSGEAESFGILRLRASLVAMCSAQDDGERVSAGLTAGFGRLWLG